jgi:hypothetical protein
VRREFVEVTEQPLDTAENGTAPLLRQAQGNVAGGAGAGSVGTAQTTGAS